MKITGYQKLKFQNEKYEIFVKKVSAIVRGPLDDSVVRDNLKKYLFDLFYDLTEIDA